MPVQRRPKRSADPVAAASDDLAKELNTAYPDAVIDYIQHFGHIPDVFKGRVIAVDSAGFDCLYTIHGQPKRRELRILFDRVAETIDEAKDMLKAMAKEAHVVLHQNVDKTYVSPNAKKYKDWTAPKPRPAAVLSVVWVVALAGALVDDDLLPHSSLVVARQHAGGMFVMEKVLIAIIVMHAVETLVAIGLCLYARVPAKATLQWIPTVFIFGVPSLQDCLRVCVRHAMHRDPVTFGVPEGVLNGDYMKYRRIITDADLATNELSAVDDSK
ncbi:hypothetical protein HDU84_004251 [Entophlyctis sp. JEL0112]|nr:hypothetical protein HDU84_004251 [Entophlyctis sp. JEL0112]